MNSIKEKAFNGFLWRFIQNSSSQIIGFIISIILARILSPTDYGIVAKVTVFISIALVFINIGFSSSIIQRKDLSDIDKDSIFWAGLFVSIVLFVLLFFSAPLIAKLYHEQSLIKMVRFESSIIVFGALYSVQQALLTRFFHFKKSFIINLGGVFAHGFIGIITAKNGYGAWALVYGSVSNYITSMIIAWMIVEWKPKIRISFLSIKKMLSFSIKMLIGGLLDSIFQNIRSLIIGTRYSSEDLAFYNRGYQFPSLLMTQVDGAMTTVLFSALSKYQDDWKTGLNALRKSIKASMYVCVPLMVGLFVVARPMILFLLTEKYENSIIYVQLGAIICVLWPLSARMHALNARGKSGVVLIVKIINKIVILVAILVSYSISVFALVFASLVASLITQIIETIIYSHYLDYRIIDQLKDIFPPVFMSGIMGLSVYWIQFLDLSFFLILILQVSVGVFMYIALSLIFKNDSFFFLFNLFKSIMKKQAKDVDL